MRNIFIFIRRYITFFAFLALQVICIIMMANYNTTHEAAFASVANEVTGRINTQYNNVEYYFRLKKTNTELAEENARLRNLLKQNFEGSDTSKVFYIDSVYKDTANRIRKFSWLAAKVIRNSTDRQTNTITLQRGALQGVKKGMAAVSGNNTVVGIVVEVSDNYSIVMSLLHRDSKVSSMLKKDNNTGSTRWDGKNPQLLTLANITKSAKITVGDTVLTTGFGSYPAGLMIGTVNKIDADPASTFFTLQVKSATNFSSLQYIYLVDNLAYAEQKQLEEKIQTINE